jgi:hypothetical protein
MAIGTKNRRMRMNKVRIGVLLITALIAVGPALAKGPRPDPVTGSPMCQVQPTPVLNGQQYTVKGSGYAPYTNLTIFVGGGSILMTASDFLGNFTSSAWLAGAVPGTYPVVVYAQSDSRHRSPLANCSLQVN